MSGSQDWSGTSSLRRRSASGPAGSWRSVFVAGIVALAFGACGAQSPEPALSEGAEPAMEKLEGIAATGTRDDAMALYRAGDAKTAVQVLERISRKDPSGRVGDEASLMLGNLLIKLRRHADAIAPLERVVKSGRVAFGYARVLWVQAVLEGGLTERLEEAERIAAGYVEGREDAESPLIVERLAAFLVKVRAAQKNLGPAIAAGRMYEERWPTGPAIDEVRWLTAEALRATDANREAYALYEVIWYETPASPWAKEAHQQLAAFRSSYGFGPRRLTSADRYRFIERLQRTGLHPEALDEIERYLSQPSAEQRDAAFRLRAASLYALRRNNEAVQTAEQMRRLFPSSGQLPGAAILAIRALRRSNSEIEIRRWAQWIVQGYPRSPEATEALYNLGVFLVNTDKEREGIEILGQVAAVGSRFGDADDALWKIAWACRKVGQTSDAVRSLRRLLDEHPKSGFRKAALYWVARFTADDDPWTAASLYEILLREYPNDYYGHEAARNLVGLGRVVRWEEFGNGKSFPVVDSLDDVTRRPEFEAYARAVNLKRAGLYEFAAEEINSLPETRRDPTLQFALADLLSRAGNTWEAAAILGQHFKEFTVAGSRDPRLVPIDFWYTFYPYNYRPVIEKAVRESGLASASIEPALVASLIRMESRFLPTAVSPVGAIGLMQLMPETAQKLAMQMTGGTVSRVELFDPETNIRYGTRYLADRVKDFKGEWFPAICSYNAGVDPVREWWTRRPLNQATDEFIEQIPYLDTRLYIKQVLGDYRNYEWIYSQAR